MDITCVKVGKQHLSLDLVEEADDMNKKACEMRQTSTTCFVAHEHRVLCNQFTNWPVEYQFWEKRAMECVKDKNIKITSAQVTEAQNSASDLRSVGNVTTFLALIEVTDILTRASCQLQDTSHFPWHYVDVIDDLLLKLQLVYDSFINGVLPDTSKESPFSSKYCKQTIWESHHGSL